MDNAEVKRSNFTIRKVRDADHGELLAGYIVGVDTETSDNRDTPWWMPDSADDVDRLVMQHQSMIDRLDANIAELTAMKRSHQSRIAAIIQRYGDLFPAPADGKAYVNYRGFFSGGNYRNQPSREPALSMVDGVEATKAGLTTMKPSLVVSTARQFMEQHGRDALIQAGVAVEDKPAISFSPATGKFTTASTPHGAEQTNEAQQTQS